MNDHMTQRAIAPWFGGKRTLAAEIVRAVGPHRSYWDPFCGSMAVLFAKPVATSETVNDLHRDLVNLARVVRCETLSGLLHWRLLRTIPAESLFRESLAVIRGGQAPDSQADPSVDRAYHYFVASWLGMNGIAGTPAGNIGFARRFSSKGGAPGLRFAGAVDSLPWWHERLRHVMILSACGVELCERIEDRTGTVIYADPPYLVKGARYVHDFADADHDRLAAALCRFRHTRVVVSYYAHPRLDELYPGWNRIDVATPKAMVNAGKRTDGRAVAPEVLLINGPITTEVTHEVAEGEGDVRAA